MTDIAADDIKSAVMSLLCQEEFTTRLLDLVTEAVAQAVNRVNEATEARIAALEDELETTRTRLEEAELKMEDMEAYSRRNAIIISGVPEAPNDDTDRLVMDVGRAAGISLTPETLDRSHRLGRPQPGKTRPIIAKFTSFNARQKMFINRKELSAERIPNHPTLTRSAITKIYISECLTPKNQHLITSPAS